MKQDKAARAAETMVSFKMPRELFARLKRRVRSKKLTRSEYLRQLVERDTRAA